MDTQSDTQRGREAEVTVVMADLRGLTRRVSAMACSRTSKGPSTRSARCATRARRGAVKADNLAHLKRVPWRIGLAAHAGRAMIGTVEPPERRESTLIGDVVNVVSRLEEVAKQHELLLVASAETVRAAPDEGSRLLGPERQSLRGRAGSLEVYYVPSEGGMPWE